VRPLEPEFIFTYKNKALTHAFSFSLLLARYLSPYTEKNMKLNRACGENSRMASKPVRYSRISEISSQE